VYSVCVVCPVRVIVAVVALLLTSGCVSYDPQPASRPLPEMTPKPVAAASPSRSHDWRPTASPSPNSVPAVVEWAKLTPEEFNPRCEPTYSAVLTVTAKVTDPDTAPAELTVTATWSAGTRTGDVRLTYRPGDGTFVGELPRISAQEAVAPNRPPYVSVRASDPRHSGPPSMPAYASVPGVCLLLGPLTNHA